MQHSREASSDVMSNVVVTPSDVTLALHARDVAKFQKMSATGSVLSIDTSVGLASRRSATYANKCTPDPLSLRAPSTTVLKLAASNHSFVKHAEKMVTQPGT